jgi:hypothetical protein
MAKDDSPKLHRPEQRPDAGVFAFAGWAAVRASHQSSRDDDAGCDAQGGKRQATPLIELGSCSCAARAQCNIPDNAYQESSAGLSWREKRQQTMKLQATSRLVSGNACQSEGDRLAQAQGHHVRVTRLRPSAGGHEHETAQRQVRVRDLIMKVS